MKVPLIIICLVLAMTLGAGAAATTEKMTAAQAIRPDAEIQQRIAHAVSQLTKVNDGKGEQEALAALNELAEVSDRQNILVQVALFLEDAGGTEEAMGAVAVLNHFNFSAEEKLEAILPLLRSADVELKQVFEEILGTIDRLGRREPDFSYYEQVMRSKDLEACSTLVGYMYDVSPGQALLSLVEVNGLSNDERKEVLAVKSRVDDLLYRKDRGEAVFEELVTDVQQQLDHLSQHRLWWLRLYAATIIHDVPEFGSSQTVERLEADPNEITFT